MSNGKSADAVSALLQTLNFTAKGTAGSSGTPNATVVTMRASASNRILTLPPLYSVQEGWKSALIALDGDTPIVLLNKESHTQGGAWYSNHAKNHEVGLNLGEPWARLVRFNKWSIVSTTEVSESVLRLDLEPIQGSEQEVKHLDALNAEHRAMADALLK